MRLNFLSVYNCPMNYRKYFFEFEDQPWLPNTIRESMTDYLRYVLTALHFYKPIIPLIVEALQHSRTNKVVDLCSGGGGAIEQILAGLNKTADEKITILLTDKFPNIQAFELLEYKTGGQVTYADISMDASNVPPDLHGVRTIFSGFHHFDEPNARSVLKNAVDANAAICIFDGGDKNIFMWSGIIFFHSVVFLLFTPFFKPFRLSRIIFTYIIPVIPLCTVWDGIISIIRLYSPSQLLKMAVEVEHINYTWKAGKVKARYGLHVAYLIGYPKRIGNSTASTEVSHLFSPLITPTGASEVAAANAVFMALDSMVFRWRD